MLDKYVRSNKIVVDFHVHLFAAGHLPHRWFDAIARHLNARRSSGSGHQSLADKLEARILDADATLLMADLDAAGIDAAVSHPLDYGLAIGEPTASVEEIVAHNAHLQQR